jgi:hypothetical protein
LAGIKLTVLYSSSTWGHQEGVIDVAGRRNPASALSGIASSTDHVRS